MRRRAHTDTHTQNEMEDTNSKYKMCYKFLRNVVDAVAAIAVENGCDCG